jgi:hypothetical protein
MSTNLNLSSYDERPSSFESKLSPQYLEAVNASRFVKAFGITAAISGLLLFLGISILSAAIGVGAGLFIFRYDDQKFYKRFGIAVIVFACIFPLSFLGTIVLSAGVIWKGWETLQILGKEGLEDEDWKVSHKRTLIGTISACVGLALSLVAIVLTVLVILALSTFGR